MVIVCSLGLYLWLLRNIEEVIAMLITHRPHRRKKFRTHGFLKRMRTHGGRAIVRRRRAKGRKRISI